MLQLIDRSVTNLFNGEVFSDFKIISSESQKRVVIKTALIAATVGLITGLAFGAIPAIIITGFVGIAAFSYSTTRFLSLEGDDLIDDAIKGTARLYRSAEKKVKNLINPPKKEVRFATVQNENLRTRRGR